MTILFFSSHMKDELQHRFKEGIFDVFQLIFHMAVPKKKTFRVEEGVFDVHMCFN